MWAWERCYHWSPFLRLRTDESCLDNSNRDVATLRAAILQPTSTVVCCEDLSWCSFVCKRLCEVDSEPETSRVGAQLWMLGYTGLRIPSFPSERETEPLHGELRRLERRHDYGHSGEAVRLSERQSILDVTHVIRPAMCLSVAVMVYRCDVTWGRPRPIEDTCPTPRTIGLPSRSIPSTYVSAKSNVPEAGKWLRNRQNMATVDNRTVTYQESPRSYKRRQRQCILHAAAAVFAKTQGAAQGEADCAN